MPRLQDEDFETLVILAFAMTALTTAFWIAFRLTHQHDPRQGELVLTAATGILDLCVLPFAAYRALRARRVES
jgi:hypothetical protein